MAGKASEAKGRRGLASAWPPWHGSWGHPILRHVLAGMLARAASLSLGINWPDYESLVMGREMNSPILDFISREPEIVSREQKDRPGC